MTYTKRFCAVLLTLFLGTPCLAAVELSWGGLVAAGRDSLDRGDSNQAKVYFDAALTKARQFSANDRRLWESHRFLADALLAQGKAEAAEQHLYDALRISVDRLGRDHPDVALSHSQLGDYYLAVGDYDAAAAAFELALETWERSEGPDSLSAAGVMAKLGEVALALGDLKTAESQYSRSLGLRERLSGREHPSVAESLGGLAQVHWQRKDFETAERMLRRALTIHARHSEPDHPSAQQNLSDLQALRQRQEEWKRTLADTADQTVKAIQPAPRGETLSPIPASYDPSGALASRVAHRQLAQNTQGKKANDDVDSRHVLALGTYASRKEADIAWARLQERYSDLLGDMRGRVTATGNQTGSYQIVAVPLPNRATGLDLCWQLASNGPQCRVLQSLALDTAIAPDKETAPPAKDGEQKLASTARTYGVQLASFRSLKQAEKEWWRIKKDFPELFGGFELTVQKVNLQDRGTYHRVQTGPFSNRAAASELCLKLKASNQDCLVVGDWTALAR